MKKIKTIVLSSVFIFFSTLYANSDPIPYDDDWSLLVLDPVQSSEIKITNNNLEYKSKRFKLNTSKSIDIHILNNNIFVYEKKNQILNIYNMNNDKLLKIDWKFGVLKAVMSKCSDLEKNSIFYKYKNTSNSEYFFLTDYPLSQRSKNYSSQYALEGGRLSLVYSEKLGWVSDKKGFLGPDKVLLDNHLQYIGDILSINKIKNCQFAKHYKN